MATLKDESKFRADVRKQLLQLNALVVPYIGNKFGLPGWPDCYVHHKYWRGWIEFKTHKGKLSKIQAIRLRELCERWPLSGVVLRESVGGNLQVESYSDACMFSAPRGNMKSVLLFLHTQQTKLILERSL